ncbi:MAG TPA: O-antigen ligase family protein [Thermoleophilaceae bacterium]|nr:O-antigen ligase family protein [Thermoleophilaceae bacterium]
MSTLAPRVQPPPASPRAALPPLNPAVIIGVVFVACLAVGALMAQNPPLAIGLVVGLCYLPLVLVNLPLGIALWVPTTFLTGMPGVSAASQAAGLLIAFAWFGTLRARAHREHVHAPRGLLLLVALFIVWLALSIVWAEAPGDAFAALQPWLACALMFTVLVTLDLERGQIRTLAFAFLAGVTFSVALGLIGGVEAPTADSAIRAEGRLSGGLDDPNYLAAGIVPSIAMAAGLLAGVRSALVRLAMAASVVILVLGLAATQSRGGLIAALVATAAAVVVAKRARVAVVAFIVIVVGLVAIWFASSPDAWQRITDTADQGNGRGSLWKVAGRIASDHPIAGVGLNNYRVYAPRYVDGPGELTFVNFIAERPHVVHNVYLQMLVEVGIVGTALFLILAGGALAAAMRAARQYERNGDLESAAFGRGVFVAILAGLAASFFISNGDGFMLWVLLALGPVLLRDAERDSEGAPAPAPVPQAAEPISRRTPALQA